MNKKLIVEIFDFCSGFKFDREYVIRSQKTLFEVIARATECEVIIKTNLPNTQDRNNETMEPCDANPYPHYHYSIIVKHNGISKEARINEKKAYAEKLLKESQKTKKVRKVRVAPKRKKKT